jgi:hypothetical protein
VKALFQTPVYGLAMFSLFKSYIPAKLGVDIVYPFKVKMAKLRFFYAVGDELGNWFKANYCLEDVVEGKEPTVVNLKEIMVHFKEFVGAKTGVGAFTTAMIRLCGKRVDGRAGYLSIEINDHITYCRVMFELLNLLMLFLMYLTIFLLIFLMMIKRMQWMLTCKLIPQLENI